MHKEALLQAKILPIIVAGTSARLASALARSGRSHRSIRVDGQRGGRLFAYGKAVKCVTLPLPVGVGHRHTPPHGGDKPCKLLLVAAAPALSQGALARHVPTHCRPQNSAKVPASQRPKQNLLLKLE